MAYDLLDKKTRARVDELIRRHPDYARFSEGVGPNPERIARWAFVHAAAWADDIKFDERFYDDTRLDAKPAPPIPPFLDMKRHTNWHYVNLYFSPDETPLPDTPTINAQPSSHDMSKGSAATRAGTTSLGCFMSKGTCTSRCTACHD